MIPEFDFIDSLRADATLPEGVEFGIGDDTAVLADQFDLVTTDMLVEGVHFRFDYCEPEDVGWKALTASLSDIAAMGGRPGPYVVSVCLGPDHGEELARGLVDGMRGVVEAHGIGSTVAAIGGDLSSSPGPAVISIALLGTLAGPNPILRSGAGVGDRIVLVGTPGLSAAGLSIFGGDVDVGDKAVETRLERSYCRPTAEIEAGRWIGENAAATAMIDVSDGLIQDLRHVLEESGVGARLEEEALPIAGELAPVVEALEVDSREFVYGGGEDFCLLACVPPDRLSRLESGARAAGWPYAVIGDIVPAETDLEIVDKSGNQLPVPSAGYQHFADGG